MEKHNKTRALVLTGLFAALTAVGAFLRVPVGASSFTLQVLVTFLAGTLLGPRWGAASQIVYVLLGLCGLPVFTGGGGPGYLLQPTCGFLLGLPLMAWLVGRLTRRGPGPAGTALACLAGLAVLYTVGMPYMGLVLNGYLHKGMSLEALLWAGMLPFLPFDALKIAVAAVTAPVLRRRLSGAAA